MVGKYIPAKGDIVKLNFNTLGREKAGFRLALIVTMREFNQSTHQEHIQHSRAIAGFLADEIG